MRLTVRRHRAVAMFLVTAAVLAPSAACGTDPSTTTDDFTARPDPTDPTRPTMTDAGASSDGAAPAQEEVVVPETEALCALTGPPPSTPGDVLVFDQEFDEAPLDATKWTLRNGFRRPGILNYFTPANVAVEDGFLRVTTTPNPAPTDPLYPYNGGFADTLGKWARTYGRIEFRARFPFAAGVWYAMWGRPWSQPFPEIDIELINRPGDTKSQLYFVHHWAPPPLPVDQRRAYTLYQGPDFSQFHTFTIDWKPGQLLWKLDGVTKMQATGEHVPNLPIYWMINSWVGGWPGKPSAATPFPVTFEVDYMRVYRVDGLVADPLVRFNSPPTSVVSRKSWLDVGVANFDEVCAHVELREGDNVLWKTSTAPYRVPLSVLSTGKHTVQLVATDGVRSATFTQEIEVK